MKKDIRKNVLPEGEIIPLKTDFIFTQIFNDPENIEIVEGFISSYFNMSLEEVHNKIEVKPRDLDIENKKESNNEVDLLLELENKEKINIEISTNMSEGVKDRNVVFLSKIHSKNLEYGMEDYTLIYPSIQINLVSHNINKKKIIEKYYLRNEEGEVLTKKFRIDYIDMAKAKEVCYNDEKEERIRKWCLVLMTSDRKEFERTLKESNIMSEKAKKKLSGDIEKLSRDEDTVVIYTKLSKRQMEHNTILKEAKMAKETGYNEGHEEGYNEGHEAGYKDGIEQGIEQSTILMAKKLLEKNMDIDTISEITGLSIDKIREL